ncbi:MAG: DNRLRE domain-containing protein [Candidatus Dormibacteraeota bacterium]|nr:DNRLRE domain-containing protein [Candidatus Dormibacteraeota bacterium]
MQGAVARLATDGGTLDLSFAGAANGVAATRVPGSTGETLVYSGALPGNSAVELTSLSRGYQATVVTAAPIPAGILVQQLRIPRGYQVREASGVVQIMDARGSEVATVAGERAGSGAADAAVQVHLLRVAAGIATIQAVIDPGWLTQRPRGQAIRVTTTLLKSASPLRWADVTGTGAGPRATALVGNTGTGPSRLLLSWPVSLPTGSKLLAATLSMYETGAASCTPSKLEVRQLTSAFDRGTNWTTQPNSASAAIATAQAAAGAAGCDSPAWLSLDVSAAVRQWLSGVADNHGLAVQAANESDVSAVKTFAGPMSATGPLLDVTYQAPKAAGRAPVTQTVNPGPPTPINPSAERAPPHALPASATNTDAGGNDEIVPERTATTKTFLKPDKTKVTQVYLAPVHMRDSSGAWIDIDPTLVSSPGSRMRTKATEHPLDAALDQTDPNLAKLIIDPAHEVSFGFAGARPGRGAASGNSVVYSEIAPGVDLQVLARPAGLDDNIILKSTNAPTTYVFPLRLKGLKVAIEASTGDLVYSDSKTGIEMARTPTGFMEDASIDAHSGLGARSLGVTYSLVPYQSGTAVQVSLDRGWLSDSSRKFPVRVDPPVTTTINTAEDDTYVASNYVGDFAGQTEFFVGTWDSGVHLYHSYMHFDFSSLNGKHILGATFYVYEHWSWSCQARGVGVYRVSQGWGGHSMTSWPGASYAEEIAWAAFAHGYTGCAAAWQGFNITGAVANWTSGYWPSLGLMIREDTVSTSDNFAWKRFWTYNYGNGVTPHVDVAWKDRPSAATLLSPANGTNFNTSTPSLSATATSPQGYPLTYHYYVCNSQAAAQAVSATQPTAANCNGPLNSSGAVTVPAGWCTSAAACWWSVLVDDGDYNLQSPTAWSFTAGIAPIAIPSTAALTPPTPTAAGSQRMTVTNYTSTTWGAGYVVSYHLSSADGNTELLHQGHQTALPSAVAPGASISMTAILDPVAPGTYTVKWEIEQTPSTWFYPPIPMQWAKTPFSSVAPPTINSTSPATGATVPSLTPTLSANATDPQGKAMTYHFRICTGSDVASGACVDSGTINAPSWTIPKNHLSWSTTYYWAVYVSNGAGTAPSANSTITPTLPVVQPSWSFGWDPFTSFSGGVNTALGNYVTSTTDLQISTVGPRLQVTRTYNSSDGHAGWFGKGWSSTYETWIETSTDAYANATVHYPDGRLEFHSNNQDGTFADALGFASHLTGSAATAYTLASPDHSQLTFNGPSGRLTSSQDSNGRVMTLTYNNAITPPQLTTVTDITSGRALHFTWGTTQPTSVASDPPTSGGAPLTAYYAYTSGQLTSVCDVRSASATDTTYCTSMAYTAAPQLSKITRPRGNPAVVLTYDAQGRVTTQQDGMSPANQWTYVYAKSTVTGESNQTSVTDPRGNTTVSGYNSLNQMMRHVDEEGRARTFGFDSRGFVNLVTNENGNTVTFNHDDHGNINSLVDGTGNTTYFSYYRNDANPADLRNDRLIGQRDARSASATDPTYLTTFDYDALGNKIRQTGPPTADVAGGAVTNWTYSDGTAAYPAYGGGNTPTGLLVQIKDPRNNQVRFAYDTKGDLRQTISVVGLTTTYAYDNLGRRISQTAFPTGFSSGVTTAYGLDGLGNITSTIAPGARNPITGVTHTAVTTSTYDPNGNLKSVALSDSTGGDVTRTTTYSYDGDDRVSTITNPEGGITTTSYDALGNPTRTIDPGGHEIDTSYTGRSQPLQITVKGFVDNPVTGTTPRDVTIASYAYDAGGRRVSFTDALGHQRTYAWSGNDLLKQVSLLNYHNLDGTSRTMILSALSYDAAGDLTSVTVGTPGTGIRTTSMTYDPAGHIKTVSADPGGLNRVTTLTYDASGNVLSRSLTDGSVTESLSYAYDAGGRQTQMAQNIGASSLITTTMYDNRGLATAKVDPRGNVSGAVPASFETDNVYDEVGHMTTTTAPTVSVESGGSAATQTRPAVSFGYDTFSDQTQSRDANGNVTTTAYDRLSRRTSVAYPRYVTPATPATAGGTAINPAESWSYDAVGNVSRHTDARGQSTDYTYDARGRLVQQMDPLVTGQTTRGTMTYTYDDNGKALSRVDQIGARSEATYDDAGRVRTVTQVVRGATTARYTSSFDYSDLNDSVTQITPANETTVNVYDNLGDLTQSTDGNGQVTSYTYDLQGRSRRTTDGLNRASENVYDLAGRLTAIKAYDRNGGLLAQAQFGYDAAGNVTTATSPKGVLGGYSTTNTFDALSRLTSSVEPVSASASITTSFGYDAAGNQTRVTDGNGHATVKTYNALGLPEATIEPATAAFPASVDRTFITTYDAGGLPVTFNPPGVTISRTFNELAKLTQESGAGTNFATATRSLGWDLASRLVSASHPSGTISLTRDDRGLLTAQSSPTDSSSFVYDADGRTTSQTDTAGTATFAYLGNGLLKSATDPVTGITTSYNYDAAGQMTSSTTGTAAATRTLTYDDLGRPVTDVVGDPANPSTATHTINYGYDANSNRTSAVVGPAGLTNGAASNFAYTYDLADRLTGWTDNTANSTVTYGWDGAGNRITSGPTTATYDERNRIQSTSTGTTYGWNANGTLSSTTAAGTTTSYSFDGLNQLTSDQAYTAYAYDGLGRLARKTYTPPGGGCAPRCVNPTRSSYSQVPAAVPPCCISRPIVTTLKYSGTGAKPVSDGSYTYSRLPSGSLLGITNGTTARKAGLDAHGDLTYTYGASGAIIDAASYDPFGTPKAAFASGGPTVGYQAEWGSDGNLNMSDRWYRPNTGTFLSRDSVSPSFGTSSDVNRYLYGGANPINRSDPTGMWWGPTYKVCEFLIFFCHDQADWHPDWVGQPLDCAFQWRDACNFPYADAQPPDPTPTPPPPSSTSTGQVSGGGSPGTHPAGGGSGGSHGSGGGKPPPFNPGPQDQNRSGYDPNWAAHSPGYQSGQAPTATGMPGTVAPSDAASVATSETVNNPTPANNDFWACNACDPMYTGTGAVQRIGVGFVHAGTDMVTGIAKGIWGFATSGDARSDAMLNLAELFNPVIGGEDRTLKGRIAGQANADWQSMSTGSLADREEGVGGTLFDVASILFGTKGMGAIKAGGVAGGVGRAAELGNRLPTVVFSRSRAPGLATNFDRAVAAGKPTTVNRVLSKAQRDANRRAALRGQQPAPAGQSLDEYPFACTIQGGTGACVLAVPEGEQSYQGGVLSTFFQREGIAPGDPFNVQFGP